MRFRFSLGTRASFSAALRALKDVVGPIVCSMPPVYAPGALLGERAVADKTVNQLKLQNKKEVR